ncbi:MAG: sugar phosphate isomerase/epimerase [Eubacterium sp.]|nr:sugar phosphate isomerase/epimerase [Eubacterium sp.]MBQ6362773.1 sugar phosphate isomerase/epimerase [Lachnospiraceae bacterium]
MWNEITITGFADEIAPELETQIEVSRKLDIHYIEMRGVGGKGLVFHTIPEVREIKKQLDDAGMKISSVGSPIGKIQITDSVEPDLELLKHTAEIAHILETPNIRMFSYYMPEGQDPALYRGEVMDRTGKMRDIAVADDVILLHENEKGIYGDIAPRCLDLLKEFSGEHYRAVFDFANFVQCGQDTLEAWDLLKSYVDYIHIKDALAESGQVVPAGHGDGHVAEILKKLKESGYAGFLSLEPHLQSFTGFGALESGKTEDTPRPYTGEEIYTIASTALRDILKTL